MENEKRINRALISYEEALSVKPDFLDIRKPESNWILTIKRKDGTFEEIEGTDWFVQSIYGMFEPAIVAVDGVPIYDTIQHVEAPSINVVVWGLDENNKVHVGMLSQYRMHPQDPEDEEGKQGVIFSHVPMGFIDGEGEDMETPKEAALREVIEELGTNLIKDIKLPNAPFHFPTTNSKIAENVLFVEVDIKKLDNVKESVGEHILNRQFIPLKQLWADIREGRTERGIVRLATSNSALLLWLSNLGTLYRESKDRDLVSKTSK